jgi:hypothetical protein
LVPIPQLGTGIQLRGVGAATDGRRAGGNFGNGVSAQGGAARATVVLFGTKLDLRVAGAVGYVTCARNPSSPTGLSPEFNEGKNQTAGIWINDGDELRVQGPFTLPLRVLTLRLNQTNVRNTANGKEMLQRAIEINSPLLPTIVVGEARVGYTGNPCQRQPIPPNN